MRVGDLGGGTVRLRLQDNGPIAEPRGGHGQHATELPATDDADGRARRKGCGHG